MSERVRSGRSGKSSKHPIIDYDKWQFVLPEIRRKCQESNCFLLYQYSGAKKHKDEPENV